MPPRLAVGGLCRVVAPISARTTVAMPSICTGQGLTEHDDAKGGRVASAEVLASANAAAAASVMTTPSTVRGRGAASIAGLAAPRETVCPVKAVSL
jgi:hypothetical protein